MRKGIRVLTLAVLFVSLALIGCSVNSGPESDVSAIMIVSPSDATTAEYLAAQEVRRYVYLRTGKLLPIVRSGKNLPSKTSLIIVGQKDRPAIRAITDEKSSWHRVAGILPAIRGRDALDTSCKMASAIIWPITAGESGRP